MSLSNHELTLRQAQGERTNFDLISASFGYNRSLFNRRNDPL